MGVRVGWGGHETMRFPLEEMSGTTALTTKEVEQTLWHRDVLGGVYYILLR